ncbi:MAG TPA: hypothetical protein PKL77_04655 [Candidatus Omnitrophota bacterium]|nr:hypothetical protein [Candidatus Omnitrophota bacterium]
MVRTTDYQARRRAILACAINTYIMDAIPVSSEDIAGKFDLSSATIRNIFAELEESGYLTHPYTSAGRVPTAKGYRYYVDYLLSQIDLLDDEKKRIVHEYNRQINHLEDTLEKTSELLSTITHYAGIVSVMERHDRFYYNGLGQILDQPEFQDASRIRYIVRMIEDKQKLLTVINRELKDKKVVVYIGDELECEEMNDCALVVSSYSVKNKPNGRIAVLGPTRMKYNHIIPTLEYVSGILSDVLHDI